MPGSSELAQTVVHAAILLIAAIAAFTDARRGEIPNWLTYPLIVLAPIAHGLVSGFSALLHSVIGLLVCALVPLFLFFRGEGMAAGDVKAFTAIGAVGGVYLGLEAQLLSMIGAAFYAVGHLAWNGRLLRGLSNSVFVAVNPVLPNRWRRPLPPELMHKIRLGPAILLGAMITVVDKYPELWV
jgi:prepilin peptidase CpaA